jgi:hypothetical protein
LWISKRKKNREANGVSATENASEATTRSDSADEIEVKRRISIDEENVLRRGGLTTVKPKKVGFRVAAILSDSTSRGCPSVRKPRKRLRHHG